MSALFFKKIIPLNKIVKLMIISDFMLNGAWGLVMPILAVFIVRNIEGGDASVVGLAVGFYWVVKSLLQIPIAGWLERHENEKTDYYAMILGLFIAAFIPLGFLFTSQPWHLYVLQFAHALAMAFVVPSWSGIFTRHIDKGKEDSTWAWESSGLGFGYGISVIAGGIIAETIGFKLLFLLVSLFSFMSATLLIAIKKDLSPPKKGTIFFPKRNPFRKQAC